MYHETRQAYYYHMLVKAVLVQEQLRIITTDVWDAKQVTKQVKFIAGHSVSKMSDLLQHK